MPESLPQKPPKSRKEVQVLRLMRVKHWIKNILVIAPVIFSQRFFEQGMLQRSVASFVSFSLMASAVYVLNDINDVEKDRMHPTKCHRPIASGAISIKEAYILLSILMLGSLAIETVCLQRLGTPTLILLFYATMNVAYSMKLKSVPILDVVILALGYLIRVYYGATFCDIEVSGWLYLTVLAGSFFLGFGKRRGEYDVTGNSTRVVLSAYSREFLDKNMYTCLGLAICFYSLWSREAAGRLWSVPLVWIILMRYSYDIERGGDSDPMSVFLDDKVLIAISLAYAVLTIGYLYSGI